MKSSRFLPPLLWLAVITFLSLMPGDDLPGKGLFDLPHFDKAVHFGMYGLLSILLAWAYQTKTFFLFTVIFLFSTAFGGIMEILQASPSINRSASWTDLLADGAGALTGLIFSQFIPALKKQ